MLVVKCTQCSRTYRLAESLYRRKAAGYGVVITCRHCKAQIHIDEGALPPPINEAEAESDAAIDGLTLPPSAPDDAVLTPRTIKTNTPLSPLAAAPGAGPPERDVPTS